MPWDVLDTDTDIIAIHVALLPTSNNGDILCFGDWTQPDDIPQNEYTHSRIFHIANETVETFADADVPNTNSFCCGQAFLADGRLLAAGGTLGWPSEHVGIHDAHYDGERACWIYLPREKRWVRVKDLNFQPGSDSIGGGRWYPTLVTLSNAEVFAAAGHPSDTDSYPPDVTEPFKRHNNNTPERYSPTTNNWALMTSDVTAPDGTNTDSYPRFHLLPNGLLFSDTEGKGGAKRIFDPFAGIWTGPDVDVSLLPSAYGRGSSTTSVLLPLLPPTYMPRILACNSAHATAFRIDVDDSPKWVKTTNRTGAAAGKERSHACAVLLPTGQVFLSGGVTIVEQTPDEDDPAIPNIPVLESEIYNPGDFAGPESWTTVESADVGRGYHSVALLLPDGRVWTAGSTETPTPDDVLRQSEKRVEVYSPSYVGQSRPVIQNNPPSTIGYAKQFTVNVDRKISRVALMRCGSITHAFDSDQRYVGLVFTQQNNTLTITSPPNSKIAPSGYYMLWVIDENNRPCELAKFMRVADRTCEMIMDRSTFSRLEVEATFLEPDQEGLAVFEGAFYVFFDGSMPHELGLPGATPTIKLSVGSPNGPSPGDISVNLQTPGFENQPPPPDVAQRFTFLYDVRFENLEPFDFQATDQEIFITATLAGLTCQGKFRLTKTPNPYMKDGNPHWLSKDLRVFQISPEQFVGMTSICAGRHAAHFPGQIGRCLRFAR